MGLKIFTWNLRSSQHPDGGDPVQTVAAHQVGNVVLDFHLLPREPGALKQLSSGEAVVLTNKTGFLSLSLFLFGQQHLHRNSPAWRDAQRRRGPPEHTTYRSSCTPPCQTCPTGTDGPCSSRAQSPPIFSREEEESVKVQHKQQSRSYNYQKTWMRAGLSQNNSVTKIHS